MDVPFDALARPLSDDAPSGPDLEASMDAEYLDFATGVEGLLPSDTTTFFEFRSAGIALDGHVARCAGLLQRTCDLRLLFLLARLLILDRDIAGTVRCVALMRDLLDERWDTIHPQPFDDDHTLRMVTLERLDERAAIELPLQCAPLVANRSGAFSFRDRLVATGEMTPREGEAAKSEADLQRIVNGADVEALVATRDAVVSLGDALRGLRALWLQRAGHDQAPQIARLPPLLAHMADYLDELVRNKDPSRARAAVPAEDAAEGVEPSGPDTPADAAPQQRPAGAMAVDSNGEAKAALGALALYYRSREPSSPARLLVKQAEQLVGASFIDALRLLAPKTLATAVIQIDGVPAFTLPLEPLGSHLDGETGLDDDSDGEAVPKTYTLDDRASASALLAEVVRFYRSAEPSSPIPALLERAQRFASRDFAAILKELSPHS